MLWLLRQLWMKQHTSWHHEAYTCQRIIPTAARASSCKGERDEATGVSEPTGPTDAEAADARAEGHTPRFNHAATRGVDHGQSRARALAAAAGHDPPELRVAVPLPNAEDREVRRIKQQHPTPPVPREHVPTGRVCDEGFDGTVAVGHFQLCGRGARCGAAHLVQLSEAHIALDGPLGLPLRLPRCLRVRPVSL